MKPRLILICFLIVMTPIASAKHRHNSSNPGKDLADKATHNLISGFTDALKKFIDGIAESNAMLKLVKNGLVDGGFSLDNYASNWADEQLSDMTYSFNDKLNDFAIQHSERYADFLKGGDNNREKNAVYNYALITDANEDSANKLEAKAKRHAEHIKTLSKASSETKDLKSAQDASNQISLEEAITLTDLLKVEEIRLRHENARAEMELEQQRRKVHFHDMERKQ